MDRRASFKAFGNTLRGSARNFFSKNNGNGDGDGTTITLDEEYDDTSFFQDPAAHHDRDSFTANARTNAYRMSDLSESMVLDNIDNDGNYGYHPSNNQRNTSKESLGTINSNHLEEEENQDDGSSSGGSEDVYTSEEEEDDADSKITESNKHKKKKKSRKKKSKKDDNDNSHHSSKSGSRHRHHHHHHDHHKKEETTNSTVEATDDDATQTSNNTRHKKAKNQSHRPKLKPREDAPTHIKDMQQNESSPMCTVEEDMPNNIVIMSHHPEDTTHHEDDFYDDVEEEEEEDDNDDDAMSGITNNSKAKRKSKSPKRKSNKSHSHGHSHSNHDTEDNDDDDMKSMKSTKSRRRRSSSKARRKRSSSKPRHKKEPDDDQEDEDDIDGGADTDDAAPRRKNRKKKDDDDSDLQSVKSSSKSQKNSSNHRHRRRSKSRGRHRKQPSTIPEDDGEEHHDEKKDSDRRTNKAQRKYARQLSQKFGDRQQQKTRQLHPWEMTKDELNAFGDRKDSDHSDDSDYDELAPVWAEELHFQQEKKDDPSTGESDQDETLHKLGLRTDREQARASWHESQIAALLVTSNRNMGSSNSDIRGEDQPERLQAHQEEDGDVSITSAKQANKFLEAMRGKSKAAEQSLAQLSSSNGSISDNNFDVRDSSERSGGNVNRKTPVRQNSSGSTSSVLGTSAGQVWSQSGGDGAQGQPPQRYQPSMSVSNIAWDMVVPSSGLSSVYNLQQQQAQMLYNSLKPHVARIRQATKDLKQQVLQIVTEMQRLEAQNPNIKEATSQDPQAAEYERLEAERVRIFTAIDNLALLEIDMRTTLEDISIMTGMDSPDPLSSQARY